jgi:TolA-binding protein
MFRRLGVLILLTAPLSFAVSKEILDLQREIASLQEQVRQLKEGQDTKLSALTVLVQQALDTAGKSSTGVAVIQSNLQQTVKDMETRVVTPVVGLSSRMDGVQSDVRALTNAVSDLTSLLNKMESQLTDLGNAVKILSAPPAAPPPAVSQGGAPGTAPGSSQETPTISSTDLYANAQRDRQGAKWDLALDEFGQYLKWYGNTDLAPNAQFYIGWIHFSQANYDQAVKDFDMVLERYPDNNKMAEAFYYKGMSLEKLNRRTDGAKEFQELIRRFPTNDLSKQACTQLKSLGYNCGTPARSTTTKRKE